eukprot:765260-Hanusia_phi.AAC.6
MFSEAVGLFLSHPHLTLVQGLASFLYSVRLRYYAAFGDTDDIELVYGLFSRARVLDPVNVEALQGLGLMARAFLFNDTEAIACYRSTRRLGWRSDAGMVGRR